MISSADNGSDFADLSNLETVSDTLVYYTHPYTSHPVKKARLSAIMY